jgi:hypothetical protein
MEGNCLHYFARINKTVEVLLEAIGDQLFHDAPP